jgi:Spy/CpxP family protein refolding chaperone
MLRGVDLTEDQRAQVRTILEASREKLRADVLNVLTDEQKAQAAERESRFRDRRDPRP